MDKSFRNILLGGGLIVTGILFLRKFKNASSFIESLSVRVRKDSNKKIGYAWSGLSIPLAIDFSNRSATEMSVGLPDVQVYYNNTLVGQLKPNTQSVKIAAYKTSTLSNIVLELPLSKLLSTAGQIINTWITGGDYNQILNSLTLKLQLLINNKISVPLITKLGEQKSATINSNSKGVGLIPYSERKIKPFSDYSALIPPKSELQYTDPVLIPNGSVDDTVRLMLKIVRETSNDTKQLVNMLKRESLRDTLKAIFDFVYTHIAYEKDSMIQEQVRRPLRTLYDRKGDCDCYATLIGSMLYNLGVPFKFRIAEYAHKGYYQHVYVIVPYSGGYYTIDPVLDNFNEEKTPTKHKDFEI